MQEQITTLLRNTKRNGIEDLIDYMVEEGFFTAPCSSAYHLCKTGGLAEHSLNVYNVMKKLVDMFGVTNIFISQEQIAITAILHDLGKMGQYGKPMYARNYLASGKVSDKKPFEVNKELLGVPHEIRSIGLAAKFIELTEEENFAILYHNGLYGDLKYAYQNHETTLSMLLHFADLWSSRVVEK
jgi:23S rRNA maturation-related 3'-5' exoribonuclease YhaM